MSGYDKNESQVDSFQGFPAIYPSNPASVTDDLDYFEMKLHDLVRQIEGKIEYFMKKMEKHPKIHLYAHKVAVLNATKNYLSDRIGIDTLEDYKRVYSKWDKAIGISNTKSLVNAAVVLKKLE